MTEAFTLRRQDYSLAGEQTALRDSFRAYFEKTVPPSRVRAAEPGGFDRALWDELQERAIVPMGLPETAGGHGATLVELALVVEEAGRRAVPAPIADVVAAARGLARSAPDSEVLERVRDLGTIATVAPGAGECRLVPSGAIAETVLTGTDDGLVQLRGAPATLADNLACAPAGWWRVTDGTVIGTSEDWLTIEREWHILTAAALIGLGQQAVDLGVQYAKERTAFGVALGAFQAIAHPLVDAANSVDAARRLVWRAAWFSENEPDSLGALPLCALLAAGEAAERAGATTIHTQGGLGFTLESDAQLYYRRAKGWALLAGDRPTLLRRVAALTTSSREMAAR